MLLIKSNCFFKRKIPIANPRSPNMHGQTFPLTSIIPGSGVQHAACSGSNQRREFESTGSLATSGRGATGIRTRPLCSFLRTTSLMSRTSLLVVWSSRRRMFTARPAVRVQTRWTQVIFFGCRAEGGCWRVGVGDGGTSETATLS